MGARFKHPIEDGHCVMSHNVRLMAGALATYCRGITVATDGSDAFDDGNIPSGKREARL